MPASQPKELYHCLLLIHFFLLASCLGTMFVNAKKTTINLMLTSDKVCGLFSTVCDKTAAPDRRCEALVDDGNNMYIYIGTK
jgi:hypothetical protein